jgi:hemerythrin-like domain-containing protein
MLGQTEPDATALLRQEHQWVLKVADVLELLAQNAQEGGEPDFDAFGDCIRFIQLFADACHHGKEEDLLFNEMEGMGMSRDNGPLAVMLHEHRVGREYTAAMAAALDGTRGGDEDSRLRLTNAALGYVQLIRNHILKEDHVLFDMADQMLRGPICQRLCENYDRVCESEFDGCTKAQLEDLATGLIKRYPRPAAEA